MIKKEQSKIDFIALEEEVLERWSQEDTFNKLREKNRGNKTFSFLDGPITANNPMGVHHAWGRTYKDIFQRYKAMQGFDQRYQNGFDCQGLWVEVEVEKELGFNSKKDIEKYGIDKFVEKCKERVRKYSAVQTEQSIRLGYWMDWENSYFTYSDENNYTIWSFLKKCYERGLIYKGDDVMPWCPRCGTSLSEHEIATEGYVEIKHPSVFAQFPLIGRENEYLLVWTTTPWTLAANVAAAVKDEIDYVKVENDGKILYMAEKRLQELNGDHKILENLKGKDLIGWKYDAPFKEIPVQEGIEHKVISWDEVSEEDGTGIVHIAPGCGREDYSLSKQYDLAIIKTLDEAGNYLEGFGELSGKNISEVNDWIFKNLREKNLLYQKRTISHRYPVCWRCKTELVFRLVDEWFISMDELRGDIQEVTKKINWMPSFGLDRELDWLSNMQDWNISKKRYWGLALPIYECKSCGHIDVIGSKEELKERALSGWDKFEGKSPHKPFIDEVTISCSKCGKEVSRIPEVGNPWL
ncbi:MAG: class I tRNA ligase family protein, partial [Candidatus Marinimicrobia bacterium]|nr:class I tRNA ligase family protein [Candidatus Neomarinimicrobiota bacterium]